MRRPRITVPIVDHAQRARAMADALARHWGVDPVDVQAPHLQLIERELQQVDSLAAKRERAHLEAYLDEMRTGLAQMEGVVSAMRLQLTEAMRQLGSVRDENARLSRAIMEAGIGVES